MKELGYGKNYRYAHNEPDAFAAGENYFPEGMPAREYYRPVPRGLEIKIAEALAKRKAIAVPTSASVTSAHARSQARFMFRPRRRRCQPRTSRLHARRCAPERVGGSPQEMADPCGRAAQRAQRHAKSVGKAKAQGQDIAPLLKQIETLGTQLTEAEAELAKAQASWTHWCSGCRTLLHASVPDGRDETANSEVRRWGEPRQLRFQAARSRRDRREAGENGLRCRRQDLRCALLRAHRCACASAARADPVHARSAHRRARLPRNVRAVSRERAIADGHRTAAEVRSRPVRDRRRVRPVPDSDRGSAGHESGARHRSSRRTHCRCASSRTRRASVRRRARTARTRAA